MKKLITLLSSLLITTSSSSAVFAETIFKPTPSNAEFKYELNISAENYYLAMPWVNKYTTYYQSYITDYALENSYQNNININNLTLAEITGDSSAHSSWNKTAYSGQSLAEAVTENSFRDNINYYPKINKDNIKSIFSEVLAAHKCFILLDIGKPLTEKDKYQAKICNFFNWYLDSTDGDYHLQICSLLAGGLNSWYGGGLWNQLGTSLNLSFNVYS